MTQPDLIFQCELSGLERQELFSDENLTGALREMDAGVALALPVFSAACAQVVRQLNQTDIRTYAWLLLPPQQGYFLNVFNAKQAVARYEAFQNWSNRHNLEWNGVVLDFGPSKGELLSLSGGLPASMLVKGMTQLLTPSQVAHSQQTYRKLVHRMHNDGYAVHTIQLPWIADERRAGSKVLQRLLGCVNVMGDREVLRLHTSRMGARGAGFLWSYAPEAGAIAIGSTGNGHAISAGGSPLSWEQLSRDLLLARQWRKNIYLHSLEGCARQGFIPYLKNFDWSQPIAPPDGEARKVEKSRAALRFALWFFAHPLLVAGGVLGLYGVWRLLAHPEDSLDQDARSA